MVKLAALFAALTLLVSGCSQADDAADQAGRSVQAETSKQVADAAAQAEAKASREVAMEIQAKKKAFQGMPSAIRGQLCRLTEDGAISHGDLVALPALLAAADAKGLPADLIRPLRAAAGRGRATAAEIRSAQRACKAGN